MPIFDVDLIDLPEINMFSCALIPAQKFARTCVYLLAYPLLVQCQFAISPPHLLKYEMKFNVTIRICDDHKNKCMIFL